MNTLKTTFLMALLMEANPATAHRFIVNPLTGGGLMTLFSTHPPMEERIRRLEEMGGGRQ